LSDDVQFLGIFHFKFTINTSFPYLLVEIEFILSVVCLNHHG